MSLEIDPKDVEIPSDGRIELKDSAGNVIGDATVRRQADGSLVASVVNIRGDLAGENLQRQIEQFMRGAPIARGGVRAPVAPSGPVSLVLEPEPVMRPPKESRTCGACRLCCKVLAVQSIDKPRGEWCRYSTPTTHMGSPGTYGGGCTIYDTRPQQCRSFDCMWIMTGEKSAPDGLQDLFPLDERPDKVRAVFTPFAGGVRDPRNGAMVRAMAVHVGEQGVSSVHRTVTRIVLAGFAVLHNTTTRCVGVWLPPGFGRSPQGLPNVPGAPFPMAYMQIPESHPDSHLVNMATATDEEKARLAKLEDQARREILDQARLGGGA